MSTRLGRFTEMRERRGRKKPWKGAQRVTDPTPPEGIVYRWVRRLLKNRIGGTEEDTENVLYRSRLGYEVVRPEEVPNVESQTIEQGKMAGAVIAGDHVLMKIPQEEIDARNEHFAEKNAKQMQAVEEDLEKVNNPLMPVTKTRRSTVTIGSGRAKFATDKSEDDA